MADKQLTWEHFHLNYNIPDDIEDVDEDEEYREYYNIEETQLQELDMQHMQKYVDFTPWGPYHHLNPFSPCRMYDLWFCHIRGFSLNQVPNLKELLDSIEGLGVWKIMDQHTLVVGPTKLYSIAEVAQGIHKAFGVTQENSFQKNFLIEALSTYEEENIGIIFPNGKIVTASISDKEKFDEIEQMAGHVEGSLVIKNGQVIYDSKT